MRAGKGPKRLKTIRSLLTFLGMILPGLGVYWSLEANQPALSVGLLAVILIANIAAVLQAPREKTSKPAPAQTERN